MNQSDYSWFVESIEQIGDRDIDDPDEISRIIMDSIAQAGLDGKDEMAAVTVLIGQYCASQVLLHNFRRILVNIPEKGTAASSKSWETTASIASSFLKATLEELKSLEGFAGQKDTPWAVAMEIADSFLGKIARDFKGLQRETAVQ